tara:strand:+ start:43559 stop:44137 length:579 start_codon:yes stop_codon:yes gene_type:complete
MTNDKGPRLHNGAYTIAHPTHGHFTVKLYTAGKASQLAGSRIVALLQGPNNETDWKGVAFWNDDAGRADTWSKHRSPTRDAQQFPLDGYHWGEKWNRVEKKLAIWLDLARRAYVVTEAGLELLPTWETGGEQKIEHRPDVGLFVNDVQRGTSYWAGEGYTLLLEGKCVRCNRSLTHPESIRLGIGPECRTKL